MGRLARVLAVTIVAADQMFNFIARATGQFTDAVIPRSFSVRPIDPHFDLLPRRERREKRFSHEPLPKPRKKPLAELPPVVPLQKIHAVKVTGRTQPRGVLALRHAEKRAEHHARKTVRRPKGPRNGSRK